MKKFAKDFKEFIAKGNVMDMAVAVIIGAAFGKIVTSLVNDIIMPLISKLFGSATFADLKALLTPEVLGEDGSVVKEAVYLNYGAFIQNVVDFLLISLVIFTVLRAFMTMKKKFEKPEEPKEEEEPAETELDVLKEIRDSLKGEKAEDAGEVKEEE
ncbi:MAG: large-conductance mechanosensitive channel protein MscL [Clostridia bacterium]|nr:large-conductance mechanosensitive channel protein MscL [Clostridia bacterium]